MKFFFKALCCALVFCCIFSMTGFYGACDDIENSVFRLHILANSDSDEDQELKLKVRDGILEYTEQLFDKCSTKEESMQCAQKNINEIRQYAQSLVYRYGYDYDVSAYITKMPFNTRVYENFTLPAGTYDALRIIIGSGSGHNWWCVLYPSLCLGSAQENDDKLQATVNQGECDILTDSGKYEVKFKIVEIFESIQNLFSSR